MQGNHHPIARLVRLVSCYNKYCPLPRSLDSRLSPRVDDGDTTLPEETVAGGCRRGRAPEHNTVGARYCFSSRSGCFVGRRLSVVYVLRAPHESATSIHVTTCRASGLGPGRTANT